MTNKIKTKEFDAVEMMREIRDKMSAEISNMNYAQLKEYLKKRREQFNLKNASDRRKA
jgi:hypothetical protein